MHQSKVERARERMDALRRELRADIERDVRANLAREERRAAVRRAAGCCLLLIVVSILIAVVGAYLAARYGLLDIPYRFRR